MIKCPFCEGAGKVGAFVDSPAWSGYDPDSPCPECKGACEVDDQYHERKAKGKALRDERIARGETVYVAAKRMGIGTAKLSAMENGRIK